MRTCKFPACTKPCYQGHDFCGRTHAQQYQQTQSAQSYGGGWLASAASAVHKVMSPPLVVQQQQPNLHQHHSHKKSSKKQHKPLSKQVVFPRDIILVEVGPYTHEFSDTEFTQIKMVCAKFGIKVGRYRSTLDWVNLSPRLLCSLIPDASVNYIQKGLVQDIHWRSNGTKLSLPEIVQHIQSVFTTSVEKIHFYNADEGFYEFTNFFPAPFQRDGLMWPTSEHYFQAQKFLNPLERSHVRDLPTPRDAFNYVRISPNVRTDWPNCKVGVMKTAVLEKFSQNEDLKQMLLATGKALLVEHTVNDNFWGDGGDGTGQNMLGTILMEVRDILGQPDAPRVKKISQQGENVMPSKSATQPPADTTTPSAMLLDLSDPHRPNDMLPPTSLSPQPQQIQSYPPQSYPLNQPVQQQMNQQSHLLMQQPQSYSPPLQAHQQPQHAFPPQQLVHQPHQQPVQQQLNQQSHPLMQQPQNYSPPQQAHLQSPQNYSPQVHQQPQTYPPQQSHQHQFIHPSTGLYPSISPQQPVQSQPIHYQQPMTQQQQNPQTHTQYSATYPAQQQQQLQQQSPQYYTNY